MTDTEKDMTQRNIVKLVPDVYEEALLKALKYQAVGRKSIISIEATDFIRDNVSDKKKYKKKIWELIDVE